MFVNIMSYLTPKDETHYIDADSTIRQALEKFDYHKFSVVPLVDKDGKYCGTVSEGDILRFIKRNCNFDVDLAEDVKVMDIEKYRPYKSLDITCTLNDVTELALQQNFIPMIDGRGMYIGIIKRKEILMFLMTKANL
jgi:predicted transcriptional regulator